MQTKFDIYKDLVRTMQRDRKIHTRLLLVAGIALVVLVGYIIHLCNQIQA